MISQAFNQNCFKILTLFSISPGSRFNRKEIKERLKLQNITMDRGLLRLTSSGILKRERNYYALNFENSYTKRVIEICGSQYRELRELPLAVFLLLTDAVNSNISRGTEMHLFGSYAKLVYSDTSDVDLAIIHTEKTDRKKIGKIITRLEEVYSKHIEAHYFSKKEFYRNKSDPLVRSILKDGMRII